VSDDFNQVQAEAEAQASKQRALAMGAEK